MSNDETPDTGEGAAPAEAPTSPPPPGNRVFTRDEMRAAFGPHPWADWKPVIRRRRRR